MNIVTQSLPRGRKEMLITLTVDDMRPFVSKAALKMSTEKPIAGFRPGKAPIDRVVQQYGAMTVWKIAADIAVGKTCFQALEKEKIISVGSPEVHIEKIAPNNEFVYKAVVSLYPDVKVGSFDFSVVQKKTVVDEKEIEKIIENLRQMRAKEVLEAREAKAGDKVVIDLEVLHDKVVIEGGSQKKYPLVIGSRTMITGFEEALIGLKAGNEKSFELSFPKDYHSKDIAGKKCEFHVKLHDVYKRELSEVNDAFAQDMLRVKTVAEMRENIRKNLFEEQERQHHHESVKEMFDRLLSHSTFDDVPDVLINNEVQKMILELQESVAQQGAKFEDYLQHIKKKIDDLKIEMASEANKRVKLAVLTRKIAKEQGIVVSDEELQKELDTVVARNPGNDVVMQNTKNSGYREYLKNIMTSQKVTDWLVKKIIQVEIS